MRGGRIGGLEWQGIPAEESRRRWGGQGSEHVLICFFFSLFLGFVFGQRRGRFGGGSGGGGGGSVSDQGPVCFCYLSPFSATPLPILKPRGKAKPPVNLNRYNSCRPKQCTEENKKREEHK